MTGETPAVPEQNQSPAEYARRLHGDLTSLLETQGTYETNDAHKVRLAMPGATFTITDYNSEDLGGYPTRDTGQGIHDLQRAFRHQALQAGTAIIDVQLAAEQPNDSPDLSSVIVLQPANVVSNSLITTILELANVNPDSTEHVLLGRSLEGSYSGITEPSQYRFLTSLSQALTEGQIVGVGEVHSDDATQHEQLRAAAKFAGHLHSELSASLPLNSFDGAHHETTLQTQDGRSITIHDDFWPNLKARGLSTDKEQDLRARQEDLLNHTTILSISSPKPEDPEQTEQYLLFIPRELDPSSLIGSVMSPIDRAGNPRTPAGLPIDLDSSAYVIWEATKGHIIDPSSEPLLVSLAQTLDVPLPKQS